MATENGSGLSPEMESRVFGTIVRFLAQHRLGPTVTENAVYAKYKEAAEASPQFARWLKTTVKDLHEVRQDDVV